MNLLPEGQETYEGLVKWLKMRRDGYNRGSMTVGREWQAINNLLDEVRDAGATGMLPWQVE